MLFLLINIGIIVFVSVIFKKIKIIAIPIYLRCCKIPKVYSSNSSNINDYVNIVEITSTQHDTTIALNRFLEQIIVENDISSILKVELAFQNRFDFHEISTWNFDLESMANRRRCVRWARKRRFFAICSRRLKYVTQKTSFLRYF